MAASNIVQQPSEPPPQESATRSFTRAVADVRNGVRRRELWSVLGWQDIKQKYRRSVIGPLWITIATGAMVFGLSLLYGQMFGNELSKFLPYLAAGLILWQFVLQCIVEGAQTFVANEGALKQLPAPLTVYALRTLWRQFLLLAHNAIIYAIVIAVFFAELDQPYRMTEDDTGTLMPGLSAAMLLAIPAFLLVVVNATWIVLLFGIVSARLPDIPALITSMSQLAFFATPIIWSPDFIGGGGAVEYVVQFNPLYHLVNIVRAPLIGQTIQLSNWIVVAGAAVVGWTLTMIVMRNYRARVPYWV